jgi:polysaccharide lyase family 4-like protein
MINQEDQFSSRGRNMMQKTTILTSALVMLLSFSSVSSAYEAREIKDGGSIEGVVEYSGVTIPKDPTITLTSETAYCGNSLPAERYLIKERKVENAVVYLVGIERGKAVPDKPVIVTNTKCRFEPHVAVGFKGNRFIARNDDPVLHQFDMHAAIDGAEIYSVSLHEKGASATKTLPKTGLMELSCYVHPWQRAYVYIFDHPYATVTDENGAFVMKEVPPGTYTVAVWHESLGINEIKDVKVESSKASIIRLKYTHEVKLE